MRELMRRGKVTTPFAVEPLDSQRVNIRCLRFRDIYKIAMSAADFVNGSAFQAGRSVINIHDRAESGKKHAMKWNRAG